jgi:hypothetical protein
MPSGYHRLATIAARQHSFFTFDDALSVNVAPSTLETLVDRGIAEHLGSRVYRLAGSRPTWKGDAMRGALWSNGLVCSASAVALRDLDGGRFTRPIHVLMPFHGRPGHGLQGVVVHETRDLRAYDFDDVDGIPCTSMARTLIDYCAIVSPFQAGLALDDACLRDASTLEAVHHRYIELRRPGRKGIALMGRLLAERMGGKGFSRKALEALARNLVRSIGLPEAHKQFEIRHGTFHVAIDLAWPDIRWGIECQSIKHHLHKAGREWDKQRRRALKLLDWEIEEVTHDDLTVRRVETGHQLWQLYRKREMALSG